MRTKTLFLAMLLTFGLAISAFAQTADRGAWHDQVAQLSGQVRDDSTSELLNQAVKIVNERFALNRVNDSQLSGKDIVVVKDGRKFFSEYVGINPRFTFDSAVRKSLRTDVAFVVADAGLPTTLPVFINSKSELWKEYLKLWKSKNEFDKELAVNYLAALISGRMIYATKDVGQSLSPSDGLREEWGFLQVSLSILSVRDLDAVRSRAQRISRYCQALLDERTAVEHREDGSKILAVK